MLSGFLQLNCEGKSISNSYGVIYLGRVAKKVGLESAVIQWGRVLLGLSETQFPSFFSVEAFYLSM